MKSRKKVSRKKTAHKTKTRRSRGRTHSGRRRFTLIKRGGTITVPVIQKLRTFMVHNILPIVTQARPNIHLGHEPKPDEGGITNVNDRFHRTFADMKFEDGDIIESIRNFVDEARHTVKSADKTSTLMNKYNKIIKKLDEEEKKQTKGMMVVGTSAFTPNHEEKIKASFLDVGPIASFINPPFSSPKPERYPVYSTATVTPAKPPPKSETRPDVDRLPPDDGTPLRNPFNPDGSIPLSPFNSPPPPNQTANQENENSQLVLSPGSVPARRLRFDE